MTGKTWRHHSGAQGRMCWYIILGAVVILLAAALGFYIGQQTEPAPSAGHPLASKTIAAKETPPEAATPVPKASGPVKRVEKRGWVTRITAAPDQGSTSPRSDQAQAETEAGADPETVVAEVVAALDDPSPEVRQQALERLESVDHLAVNAALSKAISDTDEDVRDAAMEVMSAIERPSILDSLAEALSYGDEDMREQALEILEEISGPQTVDILIEKGLLNDMSEIKESAIDTLEGITDQEFTSYQEARQWWDQNKESFQFDE